MTNETKRENDVKAWQTFAQVYVERLEQEVDDHIDKHNLKRQELMRQNNPR
jgi:hypothetical protein